MSLNETIIVAHGMRTSYSQTGDVMGVSGNEPRERHLGLMALLKNGRSLLLSALFCEEDDNRCLVLPSSLITA